MLKRIITSLFCLFLIFVSIPFFGNTQFLCGQVYAGINDDQYYIPLRSESDLVKSFQAYCKSRDLTIEGSSADAITTFTTSTFNFFANSVGIDITQLQAEIKAQYDNSGTPVKFLFSATGVDAMNRIFAQFLQDNELQVGDTDIEKQVYDGAYYTDESGYSSLIYIFNRSNFNASGASNTTYLISKGSYYFINPTVLGTLSSVDVPFNNNIYTIPLYSFNNGTGFINNTSTTLFYLNGIPNGYRDFYIEDGGIVLYQYTLSDGSLSSVYLGKYAESYGYNISANRNSYFRFLQPVSNAVVNTNDDGYTPDVNIFIVSNEINNNNYEGDTYITNEGDIINNTPPGGQDPGWNVGGGQGSYDDGQGNNYTINFPDFELPDLNIDWSIQGLGNKFPFSIPFDIASLVTVLNAEPEAPRFQGTMDLGITTYDYDINLAQFDTVASACRIAELLLLVFGLIMITRSIIKG